MAAYVVAMMTVDDPEAYLRYAERTPALIARHGGRFLTRGQAITQLEGEPYDGRMVILEFPTRADLDAWYADPDYQVAMKLRQAASTTHHVLVQEGTEGSTPIPPSDGRAV